MLGRLLQTGSVLVSLVPFNIDILLAANSTTELDPFELTDIVREWLTNAFQEESLGDEYTPFQSILLNLQEDDVNIQEQTSTTIYTAPFEGVSVWTTEEGKRAPDETEVLALQVNALLNRDDELLAALQASDSPGLGDAVLNVKGNVKPSTPAPTNPPTSSGGSSDDDVDVVIIVAVVIAGLAFALLVFALVMAWRYRASMGSVAEPRRSRKSNKDQAAVGQEVSVQSQRASKAANAATTPPSEIDPDDAGGGLYPESLISEDISTSLTAYYRSGLGPSRSSNRNNSSGLNDAASVSSMESYGYSLDGYASSIVQSKEDDPY